jgi:O-antigen/teichoic acid export membrane protein
MIVFIQNLKKHSALNIPMLQSAVFRLVGCLIVFLVQLLLARLMGPRHYGDFLVIGTVMQVTITLALFGMDELAARYIPFAISKNNHSGVKGFLKFSYRFIMLSSFLAGMGLFIFLLLYSKQFHISFSEALFWGVLAMPFVAFTVQASAILRALKKVKLSLLPALYFFPLTMAVFVMMYYNSYQKLTVDAAMLLSLGAIALVSFFLNKKVNSETNPLVKTAQPEYSKSKWLGSSAFLCLASFLGILLQRSDILLVSYFSGNTIAGTYAVASGLAAILSLGTSLVTVKFRNEFAQLLAAKQWKDARKYARDSTFRVLSIVLPAALLLIVSGRWILMLFGSSYTSAFLPMIILISGYLIRSAIGLSPVILQAAGFRKRMIVLQGVSLSFQLLLNSILISKLGMTGAAIGSSIGLILFEFSSYQLVKKKLKISAGVW